MTIIRFLLSYSLLFLLVALLAAAWVYRDTLEPELRSAWSRIAARTADGERPAPSSEAASEPARSAEGTDKTMPRDATVPARAEIPAMVERPEVEASPARTVGEAMPATEDKAKAMVAESASPDAAVPSGTAMPVGPDTTATAMASQPDAAAASPGDAVVAASQPSGSEETERKATTLSEAPGEAVSGQPVPDQSDAESPAGNRLTEEAELLARARRAYWAGALPAAAAAYEALLDRDPAEADVWGELGNVYYAMGRWRDAGQAYYEAARRLIARGDTRQLGYLLRIIDSLVPGKGAELRKQLEPVAAGT